MNEHIIAEQQKRLSQAREALAIALRTLQAIEETKQGNAVTFVKALKALDLETPQRTIIAACCLLDGPPPGYSGAWG